MLGSWRTDKLDIRAGGKKISAEFLKRPYDPVGKPATVWLNGKASILCLPAEYKVNIAGLIPSGHVYGSFDCDFSGAYSGTNRFAFHTMRGKVELIPNLRRGEGFPVAYRAPNLILGLEYDGFPGEIGVSRVISWGWLLRGSKVIGLGPANSVWFNIKGEVEGYYQCDSNGVAGYNSDIHWKPYYQQFRWLNGLRVNGRLSSNKPT